MAKDSFLIYKSFYQPIKSLSDKQLGRLFKALFDYQIEGSTQVDADLQMAFAFFKNQMDIDEGKYQKVVERNKQNGSKGGRPTDEENPKNPVGYFEPKKPYNDNDNDNDNDLKDIPPNPQMGESDFIPENYLDYENEEKEKKVPAKKEKEINIPFDNFWNFYDKKVGDKDKLMRKWEKLHENERFAIMNYLPFYIQSQPDKKFRKNPETFLNNKSWNDEIIIKNGTNRRNIKKTDHESERL